MQAVFKVRVYLPETPLHGLISQTSHSHCQNFNVFLVSGWTEDVKITRTTPALQNSGSGSMYLNFSFRTGSINGFNLNT